MTIFVQLAFLASLMTSTPTTPVYPNCFNHAVEMCEELKPCTVGHVKQDYDFCAFQMSMGHTVESVF